MSIKPKRFCNKRGCRVYHNNRDGYCDEHKIKRQQVRKPKDSHRLYNNSSWRNYSKIYRREHGTCINFEWCAGIAEVVDHIVPVEEGGDFWDARNHQPLCNKCHARKSAKEGTKYISSNDRATHGKF